MKSIQEILGVQMPSDLSKPVIISADALKDCDFTTIPEGLRLHTGEPDRTIELELVEEWLRVRTFADYDYAEQDGEIELANVAELAFALIWDVCPDESPDEKERAWPKPPVSAVSLRPQSTIETILKVSRKAHEETTTFFAKDLLSRAASEMKFKPVESAELNFERK